MVEIGPVSSLPEGTTRKFTLTRDGREREAFVLHHAGGFVAYLNRCCHIPMTMDWVENQFLSDDGQHILCATHGALYEPESGECVAGPPLGQCLTRVPIEIRDGVLWADWPDGE
jgi:nitrite reductase/ring-hydroxylating ferredoxin subunit